MAKILIVGTERYSINMCDFDLFFHNSDHDVVKVLCNKKTRAKRWLNDHKNHCPSGRDKIATNLNRRDLDFWSNEKDLIKRIKDVDFDYLCIGNGNDKIGKKIQQKFKNVLFSEYGWLPWNQCFYIDDIGVGKLSSIYKTPVEKMIMLNNIDNEIKNIKTEFKNKTPTKIEFDDFIYVPLQVDTPLSDGNPDFKFNFTDIKNNLELINKIKSIIPRNTKILVKNHPLTCRPTKIPEDENIIDISKKNYCKYELFNRMKAMLAINSTSVIEAILFNKPVFAYGHDLFSGKNIVFDAPKTQEEFVEKSNLNIPEINQKKFISHLVSRQINRRRCLSDIPYVKNHFWNLNLGS